MEIQCQRRWHAIFLAKDPYYRISLTRTQVLSPRWMPKAFSPYNVPLDGQLLSTLCERGRVGARVCVFRAFGCTLPSAGVKSGKGEFILARSADE